MPGVTDSQDPLAVIRAMPQIANGSGTTVLLFENLHRFLGGVELIQAVARQAITGRGEFIGPDGFRRDGPRVRLAAHVAERPRE